MDPNILKLLTEKNIEKIYHEMGFKVFKTPKRNHNINILGIRTEPFNNKFTDIICVFWWEKDRFRIYSFSATTIPGRTWLGKKMGNKNGTFVLEHDKQYLSCFKIGYHKGRYKALVQNGNVFTGFRDNNKDSKLDLSGKVYNDVLGLNLHHASSKSISEYINGYSAGCQVMNDSGAFNYFMNIFQNRMQINILFLN